MTANQGSDAANPSIHFGKQVRKARREHGWTLRELSERTKIAVGYLSDIENGKRPPSEAVAMKMDGVFPEKRGWFMEFHHDSREWAPPGYRHLHEYENAAANLRVWCPGVVDGLVQTPGYARAHLETVLDVPPEVIEARVAARMERQRRVLHRDDPPTAWILLDELALYREVGSPEIMAGQLDHLLTVMTLPHMTISVVPAIGHAATGSGLIVMDNAVYAEHIAGGYVFTDPETMSSLGRMITKLQAESHRATHGMRLIERVKDIWATGEPPLTALLRAERA